MITIEQQLPQHDRIISAIDESIDMNPTEMLENSTTNKLFNLSQLYYRYLTVVKTKLNNSNKKMTKKIKEFDEYFENATLIYEDIKTDWFWLSNGEKMSQFISNISKIDSHKTNFMTNYSMLKSITELFGFNIWVNKLKSPKLNDSVTLTSSRNSPK
jgi:hypothetical protein